MAVVHFADGIKVGPDSTGNDRVPLYEFAEELVDSVDLGSFDAGEVRTIVLSGFSGLNRAGYTILARPMNPSACEALTIKYVWQTNLNEVSVMIKNDSSSAYTCTSFDQWVITYFNTTAP